MDGVMAVRALAYQPLKCGCDRCLITQKNLVLYGYMQARVQAQSWNHDKYGLHRHVHTRRSGMPSSLHSQARS